MRFNGSISCCSAFVNVFKHHNCSEAWSLLLIMFACVPNRSNEYTLTHSRSNESVCNYSRVCVYILANSAIRLVIWNNDLFRTERAVLWILIVSRFIPHDNLLMLIQMINICRVLSRQKVDSFTIRRQMSQIFQFL